MSAVYYKSQWAESAIGVRFIQNDYELSAKTYYFLLDEKLTSYLKEMGLLHRASFIIENENNYNYRLSPVVIVDWIKADSDKIRSVINSGSIKYLKDISFSGELPNSIHIDFNYSYTYDIDEEIRLNACSTSNTVASVNSLNSLKDAFDSLSKSLTITSSGLVNYSPSQINRKEEKNMFENIMKNFEFGKCGPAIKMSVYGAAFKNSDNTYIAFNDNKAIDVTGMTFDIDCFYKMPVAQNEIKKGDYIFHKSKPVRVVEITERGTLVCIDLFNQEEVSVVPVTNMFGFNFFTKLVNFGENLFGANIINESNPFGSMLPFFLMSDSSGKNDNFMLAMMMMNQNDNMNIQNNPLMMMALLNNNKSDMLPMLMMMNMQSAPNKKDKENN